MKLTNKTLNQSPFLRFQENLITAEEVHNAAIYGALHKEVRVHSVLEKTGLKSSGRILEQDVYKEVVNDFNILSKNETSINLDFTQSQVNMMRQGLKIILKAVKNIPKLAREQLLLTYCTLLEGLVSDTIKNFLKIYPHSLKSNKSSLKDSQLIESIIEGNTLEKLIENRVREIMYDSITGWVKYLNEKGLDVKVNTRLIEMFLVRNVLIHNNKKVGKELSKEIGGNRYSYGNNLNVTKNDIKLYKAAIEEMAKNLEIQFRIKTMK